MSDVSPHVAGPLAVRRPPIVHAAWTADWWRAGSAGPLAARFGAAPSLASLQATADRIGSARPPRWTTLLRGPAAATVRDDALVVVAGQQPCLLGGAGLVAHKAATAIALAALLTREWGRAVIPVFLLATEDSDSTEVDHLDVILPSHGQLTRLRAPLTPRQDSFFRCRVDQPLFESSKQFVLAASGTPPGAPWPDGLQVAVSFEAEFVTHVERLLHACFGHLGLVTVHAHELTGRHSRLLEAAVSAPSAVAATLVEGAAELQALGLPVSFEPEDPRPAVMESRGGRRQRIAADDTGAAARLRSDPSAFSPNAALRPVIQAAALPVVAQVGGPSELLYLGQARGLHALLDVVPPVLVPRLEATRIDRPTLRAIGGDLSRLDLAQPGSRPPGRRQPGESPDGEAGDHTPAGDPAQALLRHEERLMQEALAFAARVQSVDPAAARAARRWLARTQRGARRLAEAPIWHGRVRPAALPALRPRGRPQDTVLAWLPDAVRYGARSWTAHLVSLCRPLEPPAHVLHVPPGEPADG